MEKKIDFKKELDRLETIVDSISSDALSFDESVKLYEEGVTLIKVLEKELELAEEKIEKIVEINK